MKRLLLTATILVSTFLTGCATTFSSQVTSFNEWSASTQKSYIFERTEAQSKSPEHKLYEDQLRNQLSTMGFQEISAGATPSLKVGLQYATSISEIQLDPWHPALYDPFWGIHFSRGYYFGNPYYPFYPRRAYWRGPDMSIRALYMHQLQITMSDFQSGKKLADIRVSSEQMSPELSAQMPFMIESALKNFPGENGKTITVDLPIK